MEMSQVVADNTKKTNNNITKTPSQIPGLKNKYLANKGSEFKLTIVTSSPSPVELVELPAVVLSALLRKI
jgi:hypothetical protein